MTDPIAQLLSSDPGNPATLADDAFLDWLTGLVCRALYDESFRLRLEIRSIWRDHPELVAARARLTEAEKADRASPLHEELEQTARLLRGAERAVEGLTMAVIEGRSDDEAKLVRYEQDVEALKAKLARQEAASPTRAMVQEVRQQVDKGASATGLHEKRAELRALEQARGRGTGRAGRRFEDHGATTLEATLLPRLRSDGHTPQLLRGVTLGCARGEWDGLVVEATMKNPTRVLAMVEFKRNPDDLAHGFALRQENLAWLHGLEARYSPEAYRTQRYADGHFRGPVTEAGFTFTRESFEGLERDAATGDVLEGLVFVTHDRPLSGLSSRDRHRLLGRIASELDLDWSDPDALVTAVRSWLDPATLRTADVLQRYVSAGLRSNVAFAIDSGG
ncbi:MAG: hypothetical protein AAGA48_23305 [Myxococcota bacterium]